MNSFISKIKSHACVGIGLFLIPIFVFGLDFNLTEPSSVYFDRTHFLVMIKAYLNNNFITVPQLGFREAFNFNDIPTSDFTQRFIILILTRFSNDVFLISNLYYLSIVGLCFLISYCVFFSILRSSYLSVIFSFIFIFVPYLQIRSTEHDYLAAFYSIPLTFLLVIKIIEFKALTSLELINKFYFKPEVLICIAIISLSGIYYSVFSYYLIIISGIGLSFIRNTLLYFRVSFMVCGIGLIILMVFMLPNLLHISRLDLIIPHRSPAEQSLYGIRFADLIWTAQQYVDLTIFPKYWAWRNQTEGFDFWPGLFLSCIGILYLVLAPLILLKRAHEFRENRNGRFIQNDEFIFILVMFLISCFFVFSANGLGLIFNFVTPLIRSQARISPFFTFALLIILSLELNRCLAKYSKDGKNVSMHQTKIFVFLSLFFILNNFPFLGVLKNNQSTLFAKTDFLEDRQSVINILAVFEKEDIAFVFQAPALKWPEPPQVRDFKPYTHFLFYIFDKAESPITWSYGTSFNKRELSVLRQIDRDPDIAWSFKRLSCIGFDAILYEKRAFDANFISAIRNTASSINATVIYEDSLRIVFKNVEMTADNCDELDDFEENLETSDGSKGLRYLIQGWNTPNEYAITGRGAKQVILLPEAIAKSSNASVTLDIETGISASERPRVISVFFNGHRIEEWNLSELNKRFSRRVSIPAEFIERSGFQYLELKSDTIIPIDRDAVNTSSSEFELRLHGFIFR